MCTLKTINGKHIVSYKGTEHVFDLLHDAWEYIFILRFVNKPLGKVNK